MSRFGGPLHDVLKQAKTGTVLKPKVHSLLYDAEWEEDFAVWFRKGKTSRAADGLFHPSQHPTWPDRMLWYWAKHPEAMQTEKFEYMSTMAVTVGTAMHGFMQTILKWKGLILTDDEMRGLGFTVHDGEAQVYDEATGCTGHMDGIVRDHLPLFPEHGLHHFEFKTSNEWALNTIDDLDVDAFKKRWPYYYAQAQEYLRMSGFAVSIVLMMQMGTPWTLREFHIPRSEQFIYDTREKYLRVREAVAADRLPRPCCSGGNEAKTCPARSICPVALAA